MAKKKKTQTAEDAYASFVKQYNSGADVGEKNVFSSTTTKNGSSPYTGSSKTAEAYGAYAKSVLAKKERENRLRTQTQERYRQFQKENKALSAMSEGPNKVYRATANGLGKSAETVNRIGEGGTVQRKPTAGEAFAASVKPKQTGGASLTSYLDRQHAGSIDTNEAMRQKSMKDTSSLISQYQKELERIKAGQSTAADDRVTRTLGYTPERGATAFQQQVFKAQKDNDETAPVRQKLLDAQAQLDYLREQGELAKGADYWRGQAKGAQRTLDEMQKNAPTMRYTKDGYLDPAYQEYKDREREVRSSYDKARERLYYAKNGEQWDKMPQDVQTLAMEAGALNQQSGVMSWDINDGVERRKLFGAARDIQSAKDALRVHEIEQQLDEMGYSGADVVEYATRLYNQQMSSKAMSEAAEFATKNGWAAAGATVASYASNLLSPISTGSIIGQMAGSGSDIGNYRPVDTSTPNMAFTNYTGTVRGAVGEKLAPFGKFIYDATNSTVDSAIRMLAGNMIGTGIASGMEFASQKAAEEYVGKLVSGFITTQMSGEVLANAFVQSKQSGKSDADAMIDAMASALIESLTEKYSVEAILKNPAQLTFVELKNSFIAEGSEEMASDILEQIYQKFRYGKSGIAQEAEKYAAAGISQDEAQMLAIRDFVGETLRDGLAGGFSGLAMAGVHAGAKNYREAKQIWQRDKAIREISGDIAGDTEATAELIASGMEAAEGTRARTLAEQALQKLDAGESLTKKEVSELIRANDKAMRQEEKTAAAEAQEDEQDKEYDDGYLDSLAAEEPGRTNDEDDELDVGYPGSGNDDTSASSRFTWEQQTAETEKTTPQTTAAAAPLTRGAGEAGTEQKQSRAAEAIRRASGALYGTNVRKVTEIRDGNVWVETTDGKRQGMTGVDTRGTALAVLEPAIEDGGISDPVTMNVLVSSYGEYLDELDGRTGVSPENFAAEWIGALYAYNEGISENAVTKDYAGARKSAMRQAYIRGRELTTGRAAAAQLGESGGAVLEQYGYRNAETFRAFYELGREGRSFEEAVGAVGQLRAAQREEMKDAWKAGRKDGKHEVRVRESSERADGKDSYEPARRVEEGTGKEVSRGARDREAASLTYGEKISARELGIEDGSSKKSIRTVTAGETKETRKAAATARKAGLRVVFFAGGNIEISGKPSARGYIDLDKGICYVRVDHEQYTADQIMRHEAGHQAIRDGRVDPAEVRRKLAQRFTKKQLDRVAEIYNAAYADSGLTAEEIFEEIICDSLGDMNVFAEGEEIPAEFAAIMEEIRAEAETERELNRGPPKDEKNAAREGGVRYSINREFKKEIDEWDGKSAKTFVLGNTSEPLQSIGVKDRTLKWASDMVLHALKHDGMSREIIKQIPEMLEEPVIVMQSRTVEDRIVAMGSLNDENNVPVLAVLEVNPKNDAGTILDMNLVNNAYGKDRGIQNFLIHSKFLYLDPEKNRTDMWLHSVGLQLPFDTTTYGPIGRITYSDGNVNIQAVPFEKIGEAETQEAEKSGGKMSSETAAQRAEDYGTETDSEGRTLTEAQAAYFRDSKVRDEDGNLLVVYHGTDADFTVFDKSKGRANMDIQGSFFSPWELDAAGYGGNVKAYYLNIKNPAPEGTAYRALNRFKGQNGAGIKAREYLEKLGYDGVNNGGEEYIAFRANQIKEIRNGSPTENDDIRFSQETVPQSAAEYARRKARGELRRPVEQEMKTLMMKRSLSDHYASRYTEIVRQFAEGTTRENDAETIGMTAAGLLRSYGKKSMERGELEARLSEIANPEGQTGIERHRNAQQKATELAADMMRNMLGDGDETAQTWNDIRGAFRVPVGDGTKKTKPVTLRLDTVDYGELDRSGGITEVRRRGMGRFFLSSSRGLPVDTFYMELSSQFPAYFPAEITHPGDQLAQIDEVLTKMKATFDSPFEGANAEETDMIAMDIMERIHDGLREAPDAESAAQDREDMLRAYHAEQLQAQRDRHKTEMKKLRDEIEARKQKARDAKQEAETRNKLLHIARRMERVKYTGAEWGEKARELIGELDTAAVSLTGRTIIGNYVGNTKADDIETMGTDDLGRRIVDLNVLDAWVKEQQAVNPDFIQDKKTKDKLQRIGQKQIADMDYGDVLALLHALQNLENEMRTSKKMIASEDKRDISVQAEEVRRDIEGSAGAKVLGPGRVWNKLVVNETLSPIRFFRRITGYNDADPLLRAAEAMQRGETAMWDYRRKGEAIFKQFTDNKKFMETLAGKKAGAVEISCRTSDGIKKLKITRDMRLSLYLHSLNDSNVRHAELGGVMIPNFELLQKGKTREAYAHGTIAHFTRSELRSLYDQMSTEEKNYARTIRKYFDYSAEKINEVSRQLLGFDIATVRNYFPISVNRSFVHGDLETVKLDGSIEGMGFTKERTGAGNTIDLRGATETVQSAMEKHAKYVGMAIPVRNMGRLYGQTAWEISIDENAGGSQMADVSSMQNTIEKKWNQEATDYIEKLMADVQNPRRTSEAWDRVMGKLKSNYAGAVLTLNMSVAMKQAASYPTAAAVVGWAPLAKAAAGWGTKLDTGRLDEKTPLLWYRSIGFSSQDPASAAKGEKNMPKALNWIQAIDIGTTKLLQRAAIYYVRDNFKELTIGSEEYWAKCAEVYEKIILDTQPNYTTMERPQSLRTGSTLLQNLNMFKTQPFQNFNVLYDAAENQKAKKQQRRAAEDAYRTDASDANRQRLESAKRAEAAAKKNNAHAISALLVSSVVFAAMTLAWNALRRKKKKYENDDGEITAASFARGFGGDVAASYAGMVPFGSDLYELAYSTITGETYYGIDALTPSSLTDFLTSVTKLPDTVSAIGDALQGDKGAIDTIIAVNELLTTGSKLLGIPLENLENTAKMLAINTMEAVMPKEEAEYWYRFYTEKSTAQKRAQKDAQDIFEAYLNGSSRYTSMREKMEDYTWRKNEKYKSGAISREDAQEAAKETVDGKMKDMIREELMSGTIDEERAAELLTQIAGYTDLSDAEKVVSEWSFERETGTKYSKLKDAWMAGTISDEDVTAAKTEYGGVSKDSAENTMREWKFEKETGIAFDKVGENVVRGKLSYKEAEKLLLEHYEGMDEETASAKATGWRFEAESGIGDVSDSFCAKYYEFAEPEEIDAKTFAAFYRFQKEQTSDKDADGKTTTAKKDKVVAYIDGLKLTKEQKDALYFAMGYAESGLKDTPWHKRK